MNETPIGGSPAVAPAQRVRTLGAVALLGFSSGLPLALSGGTLEAWCAVSGLSVKTIGFMKLVAVAYVAKILWAPLVDRHQLPWMGRRRGWLLAMQLAIAATLVMMAGLSPTTSLVGIATLAVVLATFSATQDICVDAYRADQLLPRDRGLGAALGVGGYRLAMAASGGLALLLSDQVGWRLTYLAMAATMGIGIVATLIAPERTDVKPPSSLRAAYLEPLRDFLAREHAIAWLGLVVLYKLGNAFAQSLSSTFLLTAAHYSLTDVGWANKLFAFGATLLGVFLGGLLLERWPLWRTLLVFGIVQGLSAVGFLAISAGWQGTPALVVAVAAEYLASGLGTAAFVALLMALCNTKFSATQYALFSALDAVPRVFIAPFAGWVAATFDWPTYFVVSILCAAPGLLLLLRLRQSFTPTGVVGPNVRCAT